MSAIKLFGYILIGTLVLSIFIIPIVEVLNVSRERVVLSNIIHNSFRAARDSGYDYYAMRMLNSTPYEENFKKVFANTFAKSLGMTCEDESANPLVFKDSDVYNDFFVDIDFVPVVNEDDQYTVTKVTIKARSDYNFKVGYMRIIASGEEDLFRLTEEPFQLKSERTFTMQLMN